MAIGGLLSIVAPTWTAYLIAFIFDATWIGCMALEWVARYDPLSARLPRRMGWLA